jgi:excisionase family DNA binding protein
LKKVSSIQHPTEHLTIIYMSTLLTVKEVAEKLRVSTRTIQRWQDEGKIAFIKIGKCIRIREENLEGWLDKKTVPVQKKAS